MKRLLVYYMLILLAVMVYTVSEAHAVTWVGPTCTFTWDHPTPDVVQEYRIYIDGVQALATPALTATCADLELGQGTYVAHVTAANPTGESGPSNLLPFAFTVSAPVAPTGAAISP